MKNSKNYSGWELETFDNAENFRNYQFDLFKNFIRNKKILDVGSGSGGLVKYYQRVTNKIDLFEPSKKQFLQLKEKIKDCKIINTKSKLKNKYDVILFMDVIEHIKNSKKEILFYKKKLKKGGLLIFNVPSFNFLYTKFDQEVGHFKRYNVKDFYEISEKLKLDILKINYYDSIGFLLLLLNKLLFKKTLNKNKIRNATIIWNRLIYLSRYIDKLIMNMFGKSLFCVLRK
jgi:SAM-dependent methyltransferase